MESNLKKMFFKDYLLVVLILIFIIFFVFRFSVNLSVQKKIEETEIKGLVTPRLFQLEGKFIQNPEFLSDKYNKYFPLFNSFLIIKALDTNFSKWECSDWKVQYERGPIWGREGVIWIHPVDVNKPRWIETTAELNTNAKKITLVVGLANINGKVIYAYPPVDCADNGFKIKIFDLNDNTEKVLYDGIVSDKDKWVDLSFDVTEYKNHKIKIRIEGYAGGPCGNWFGEHAAVDYVDILEE